MKQTSMAWEKSYSDGSGVEYAVRYREADASIEFESLDTVTFPVTEIGWLIRCLQRIESEIGGDSTPTSKGDV